MSTLNKVEFTQCMITPNDVEYYLKNNPNGIGLSGVANLT